LGAQLVLEKKLENDDLGTAINMARVRTLWSRLGGGKSFSHRGKSEKEGSSFPDLVILLFCQEMKRGVGGVFLFGSF